MVTVNVLGSVLSHRIAGDTKAASASAIQCDEKSSSENYLYICKTGENQYELSGAGRKPEGSGRLVLAGITAAIEALRLSGAVFKLPLPQIDQIKDNSPGEPGLVTVPVLPNDPARDFQKAIHSLNCKTQAVRSSFSPPMRFILTLFGKMSLPVPINGIMDLEDIPNNSAPLVTHYHAEYSSTFTRKQRWRLSSTNLPFLNYMIDSFGEAGRYVMKGEDSCCSWSGRVSCLKNAGVQAITAIAMPVLALFTLLGKRQHFDRDNICWAIIDIPLGYIASPFIALASAIKYLVAAIIHPGIVYSAI